MHQELVRRFDARVAAAPDAIAIVDGERTVSYRHVAASSSMLARRLTEAGAGAGDIVGLASDRSIEWVVAMLATLRIGGVYLPLPPDLPRERRRLLMGEAGVRHVLRHPAVADDLGDEAVAIGVEVQPPSSVGVTAPEVVARTGDHADRACVLFTSGTTGVPKGVVVRQSSIVRLVTNTNYISFARSDAVAFASNTAFDATTFEVWGALLGGSRLVVVPASTLLSASALETFIREHGITILFLTTELFNRISRARPAAFRGLKWLLFGGERANAECVRAVLAGRGRPANLLHMYGPTECTTFATFHRVTTVAADAATVPIGVPIAGCAVHLLDDERPVADGEEGELCIAGAGLAEGYLDSPQETVRVFTTLPIDGAVTRIYRTGDRARRRSDGLIEYVGRRDGQIKLRGFRIETAEVEVALATHPAVREAVVLVYPGEGGAPRLGGCLRMTRAATERDVAAVREFVAGRLPAPMVPTRLRTYDRFPLTPSGKVDRQQLLADLLHDGPDAAAGSADGPLVPADAVERKVAAIWEAVLGHPPRHADENFFDAGGDSLQALDVQLRLESEWAGSSGPSILMESPTFSRLAEHVRRRHSPNVCPVAWLSRTCQTPVVACVPGIFGHIFFLRHLASRWPGDWSLCALPSGYLAPGGDRRLLSLEEIADDNLARLEKAGVAPVQAVAGFSFGGLVAYEMACRMVSRGLPPPAVILCDASAAGQQFRGTMLSPRPMPRWRRAYQVSRFVVSRTVHRNLHRLGWAPPAALFNPAVANLVALERYRPRPYPGDALLIRATFTRVPPDVDVETLGWGGLVRGRLIVRDVAAGHGDLFKPPHVSMVAAIAGDYLRSGDAIAGDHAAHGLCSVGLAQ